MASQLDRNELMPHVQHIHLWEAGQITDVLGPQFAHVQNGNDKGT